MAAMNYANGVTGSSMSGVWGTNINRFIDASHL